MTNREFFELVAAMRTVQRRWFGGDKSRTTLARSKLLERQVDRVLAEILAPKQQGSLFGKEATRD